MIDIVSEFNKSAASNQDVAERFKVSEDTVAEWRKGTLYPNGMVECLRVFLRDFNPDWTIRVIKRKFYETYYKFVISEAERLGLK